MKTRLKNIFAYRRILACTLCMSICETCLHFHTIHIAKKANQKQEIKSAPAESKEIEIESQL